jgi:hypothetical protein
MARVKQLTSAELRRLIKAHNKLVSINIPVGTKKEGLIKLIEDNGYKVDHENKKIIPNNATRSNPTVDLPPAPPRKTKEQVAEAKKKREKKKLEENLKLKLKVQQVKKKVSESEKKADEKKTTKLKKEAEKLKEMIKEKPTEKKKAEPKKQPKLLALEDAKKETKPEPKKKEKKNFRVINAERSQANRNYQSVYKQTPAKVLGVSARASPEEIKKAFRKFLKFHPDKHPPSERAKFTELFTKYSSAYDALISTIKILDSTK